jgi:hypothetical protein
MQAIVHAADVQDRDGGVLLMGALFGLYPFLVNVGDNPGQCGGVKSGRFILLSRRT